MFKPGDIVERINRENFSDSEGWRMDIGEQAVVVRSDEVWATLLLDGGQVAGGNLVENLKLVKEKTMDNLQVGDIITAEDREYKVLVALKGVALLSESYDFDETGTWYTTKELENAFEIPGTEEEVREMTVAEVEKLVGKKVKIVKE